MECTLLISLLPQFVWCTDILLLLSLVYYSSVKYSLPLKLRPCGEMPLPAIQMTFALFYCVLRSYSESVVGAWKLEQSSKWYGFSSLWSFKRHINPHQYTLRSLLIRTPGVHGTPVVFQALSPMSRTTLSQKWFSKSVWCLRGLWSKKNNILVAQKHSFRL